MMPLLWAALVALNPLQQSQSSAEWQIVVRPDTVTIGSPFEVILRVTAPKGSTIRFPAGPDSGASVRLLDPVSIVVNDSVTAMVQSATYRVAAWDVDLQPIELGDVIIAAPAATSPRRIHLPPQAVMVASVLPADSNAHIPKPARDLFGSLLPWWYPWLPIVLLAASLAAIFVWWYRRRKGTLRVVSTDVVAVAAEQFRRIEALRLLDAGERGRYVVLMVDVLREFLTLRFSRGSVALTSAELLTVLEKQGGLPVARIALLLNDTDMVKFAQKPLSAATALRLGRESMDIVNDVGAQAEDTSGDFDREDAA